MRILRTIAELREWRESLCTHSLGFVPTMGALHAGHQALLEKARAESGQVLLSIFVNPTQFNQLSDLENYPRTEKEDLAMARAAGVDAVFIPSDPGELYPNGYRYRVSETEFSKDLCGEFRPGHFEGMLTVVMKLFTLIQPTHAFFGEKDRQQLMLVRGMVKEFFLPVEIRGCATVRESDGLALSSRNKRLSTAEREKAPLIYRALQMAELSGARSLLENAGFRIEYLEEREGYRYIAAWLGEVRLIDNVAL